MNRLVKSSLANGRGMLGVSLIELMVALTIGTILLMGLVQVFAASRTAYQLTEGLARAQENGRFAMDYLQRDLRMAGHFGCVNDQSHKQKVGGLVSHPILPQLDFSVSIQGYEATGTAPDATLNLAAPTAGWSPGLPDYVRALAPLAGSDIVVLRFLRSSGAPVEAVAAAADTTFTVTAGRWGALTEDGVAAPTLFGVADCSSADVFTGIASSADRTVEVAAAIDRYTPHPSGQTMLYRAEAVAYYVAISGASNQPALHRTRWNGAGVAQTEELVEGIENLQFIYGQDQAPANNPSGYVGLQNTAAVLGDGAVIANEPQWRRVGLVQVGLLARSANPSNAPAPDAAARPRALGVVISAPADGRYRATYESTIALRNRLYGN